MLNSEFQVHKTPIMKQKTLKENVDQSNDAEVEKAYLRTTLNI